VTTLPPAGPPTPTRPSRRPVGRALEIALSLYGAAIFTVLWVGIAVGLWAWNAVGSALVTGAVAAGLVAWTLLMASGLVRTFRRR